MCKGRHNRKSDKRMEWYLTVGLRPKNLVHFSTSKLANLIINEGMRLWLIPLNYKALCIDKMILLSIISQSYTTSALTIGIVLKVLSVFKNL